MTIMRRNILNEYLHIESKNLTYVPTKLIELADLANVNYQSLCKNKEKIRTIHFNGNKIETVVDEINKIKKKLTKIKYLNFAFNNIELIDEISNDIEGIQCSYNNILHLNELPQNLSVIDIGGNENLRDISGLWKCEKLQEVRFNQDYLTKEILTLAKIKSNIMVKKYNGIKRVEFENGDSWVEYVNMKFLNQI